MPMAKDTTGTHRNTTVSLPKAMDAAMRTAAVAEALEAGLDEGRLNGYLSRWMRLAVKERLERQKRWPPKPSQYGLMPDKAQVPRVRGTAYRAPHVETRDELIARGVNPDTFEPLPPDHPWAVAARAAADPVPSEPDAFEGLDEVASAGAAHEEDIV